MRRDLWWLIVGVSVLAATAMGGLLSRTGHFKDDAPLHSAVPPPQPLASEALWVGEDNQIRRAAVDTERHALFISTVAASIAQDRQRLAAALEPRLRAELDAVLGLMEARAPALAEEIFSFGSSYKLVMWAMMAPADEDESRPLEARGQEVMESFFHDVYSDRVVQPQTTLPRVKAAVSIAFSDTRRDLLRSCDKYDQAFQDFLTREARHVERLSAGTGWASDDVWNRANAKYRSLCHTARLADSMAGVIDPGSFEALSVMPPSMISMSNRLAATLTTSIREPRATTHDITHFLSNFGLPRTWTASPAALLATVRRSPDLYDMTTAKFGENANRADVVAATRLAVKDARNHFETKVRIALLRFVDLELEAIAERLAVPLGEAGQEISARKNHSPKEIAQNKSP